MFNLEPWTWPEVTLVKHALCTSSHGTFICARSFQNVTNPSRVIERTRNTVLPWTITLSLNRPWPNICTAYRLIILDICAKLFENPTRGSKDNIEQTQNTVIQCLTLNYDLDLEPTLVKHTHCTSSHHTWLLCQVIWKSHQGFIRYSVDNPTRGSQDIAWTIPLGVHKI